MANVSIEINNREFLIACSDGDEEKVRMLGKKFSERVMNIKGKVGDLDQQRLFLLAGILAEEENLELTDDLGLEEMTSVLKSIKDKIDDNI
ncbi:cell division protein ZapA [Rhodobiaceae bacterium]|nr:cell division protein ZapA [Rhodobiaceae bacterium]|tara:strand:- start:2571 stop:2843 length:273 start_codon:yes stop_codon:yes gene_type:complete